MVDHATENAVAITDARGRIEWVNGAFTRMTGYGLDEAVGHTRRDLQTGPESNSAVMAAVFAQVGGGEGIDGELQLTARGGRQYWARMLVRPVVEDGAIAHIVDFEQDVTARREAEDQLRTATKRAEALALALSCEKALLAGIMSAMPQLVFWKDARRRYVGCNDAYLAFRGCCSSEDLTGRDEAMLDQDSEIVGVLDEIEHAVLASGRPVIDRQVAVSGSDGRTRLLLLSVLPLGRDVDAQGLIGVGTDVTQVREMERHLAQASRLESIGQLASGIAHEINTPVQYVLSNTSFLTDATATLVDAVVEIEALSHRLGPDAADWAGEHARLRATLEGLDLAFLTEDIPSALKESKDGLSRVARIVGALKDFTHPGCASEDVDINRAIETTTQLSRSQWNHVADLDLDLDPDAGRVSCYPGELKQVILNIIVNAAHAMDEQRAADGGRGFGSIVLSTRREQDAVVITIAVDGPGMPESVRRKVFDPFSTTKDVGAATGQGLDWAHTVVVSRHHGHLEVTSTPGQGTQVTIRLPLHPVEPTQTT